MRLPTVPSYLGLSCLGITAPTPFTYPSVKVDGYEMVKVPGGLTVIGSAAVRHAAPRWVYLSPYAIGTAPVNWSQFNRATQRPADRPATHMNWNAASTFAKDRGLRLPTEAEWENAARGPAIDLREKLNDLMQRERVGFSPNLVDRLVKELFVENFVFDGLGQIFTDHTNELFLDLVSQGLPFFGWRVYGTSSGTLTHEEAWYGRGETAPVNWGPKGPFGMAGNVWEWVADSFHPFPQGAIDPLISMPDAPRIIRGGAFNDSLPDNLRAATRLSTRADNFDNNIGFRMAKSQDPRP